MRSVAFEAIAGVLCGVQPFRTFFVESMAFGIWQADSQDGQLLRTYRVGSLVVARLFILSEVRHSSDVWG